MLGLSPGSTIISCVTLGCVRRTFKGARNILFLDLGGNYKGVFSL